MANGQVTTYNITINLIDESGATDANKIIDAIVPKIQEASGLKVQYISATLNIKMPSSNAQRHFLDLQADGDKVKVVEVPRDAQAPPSTP